MKSFLDVLDVWLLMEHGVQERWVHLYAAVIANKTKFTELVHKYIHACASCADHLGERRLANIGNYRDRFVVLAEVGQYEQQAREPLFTRVEQLINQIGFYTDRALE